MYINSIQGNQVALTSTCVRAELGPRSCQPPLRNVLNLQSKPFSGMPKSPRSYDSKPWDKDFSPVSQEIQRSDLARAQLLSTGGKHSPKAQGPAASRRDSAGDLGALQQEKPLNAPASEEAPTATETPGLRAGAAAKGRSTPARHVPSVEHRQNNAALGGPGSQLEAAAETPTIIKAVFARQLGEGGGNFPTPEVPSTVKNPLFEASSSASIGSSSTGGASVRQLGLQTAGINPTFERLEAHSPACGAKSSASFRSAIRRAAHKSRQGKPDASEAHIDPQQALADDDSSSQGRQTREAGAAEQSGRVSNSGDQQALQSSSKRVQNLLPGREAANLDARPVTISARHQRQSPSGRENYLPETSTSSLASPRERERSLEHGYERKTKGASPLQSTEGRSQAAAGNGASTPQNEHTSMSSIWKLWNSGKAATESLQHEDKRSLSNRASNKSVRCSLLGSMNSVSDELR